MVMQSFNIKFYLILLIYRMRIFNLSDKETNKSEETPLIQPSEEIAITQPKLIKRKLFSKSNIKKTSVIDPYYKNDVYILIVRNVLCEITEAEMVSSESYVVIVNETIETIYDYTGSMHDYYSRYRRIDKLFKHKVYKFVNDEPQFITEIDTNQYEIFVEKILDVPQFFRKEKDDCYTAKSTKQLLRIIHNESDGYSQKPR